MGPRCRAVASTLVYRAVALICLVLAGAAGTAASADQGAVRATFPLRVSANHRYLVDASGRPFPILGDSPQALIGDLDASDAESTSPIERRPDSTRSGSTCSARRTPAVRATAARRGGIAPFHDDRRPLDAEPGVLRARRRDDPTRRRRREWSSSSTRSRPEAGSTCSGRTASPRARAYGALPRSSLSRASRTSSGSTATTSRSWKNADDDALVLAVARGIQSVDTAHIQTVELELRHERVARRRTLAAADPARRGVHVRPDVRRGAAGVQPAAAAARLHGRGGLRVRAEQLVVLQGRPGDPPPAGVLVGAERRQPASSTATTTRGSSPTAGRTISTRPAAAQFGYMAKLFAALPWYRLVPDQRHRIVTAGYGTYTSDGNVGSSNYVTTAVDAGRHARRLVSARRRHDHGRDVAPCADRRGRWYDPYERERTDPPSRCAALAKAGPDGASRHRRQRRRRRRLGLGARAAR